MTLYTKTQLRPLINNDLKMDTLSRWLDRIEEWTLYDFNVGVPTDSKAFSHGQPIKRKVYDEADIKRLKQLYDLRVNENFPLPYAVHKIFLTEEHFNKWQKGEWDKKAEWEKLLREAQGARQE